MTRMAVGELDRRITLQQAVETRDAAGDVIATDWTVPAGWPRQGKRWSSKRDGRPQEVRGAQQQLRQVDTVFTLRWDRFSSVIAPETFRVVYRDRVYEIVGLGESVDREDGVVLLCASRPDQRGASAPLQPESSGVESSGGGEVWPPLAPDGSQPVFYADFKNGRYWADGVESADPFSLFHADADWGGFVPAEAIVPDLGLINPNSQDFTGSPVVNADLLGSLLVDGFTALIVWTSVAGAGSAASLGVVEVPAYAYDLYVGYSDEPGVEITAFGAAPVDKPFTLADTTEEGPNALAVNYTPVRVAGSENGSDPAGVALVDTGTPPNAIALTSTIAGPFSGYTTDWAVYPLQEEADLPTLSAL